MINEAVAAAVSRRPRGLRAAVPPLAAAGLVFAAMTGYGVLRLHALPAALVDAGPPLRIGLVQANIVGYERLREQFGTYAVVRRVLDTHFGLSRAALEHHQVDALLWSETIYPTTFGQPRSADGAALDQEIFAFVEAIGRPLVFGTYDRDAVGEYNSAAFVEPGTGLLGHYRKTHPFPLTEYVPAWLEGPLLRRIVPWAGSWQPGSGARVFPLRTADGREVDVLPLICLDDVRSDLAIDGARLGAQAILGMSNDSWFTDYPLGARLHLAVAAFRSIETRLPQIRVTTNGLSAIIDETGEVLVSTAMGDQAVLAGEIPARDPPPTLMVRWGDWVGRAALVLLGILLAADVWRRTAAWSAAFQRAPETKACPDIAVLAPAWRVVAAVLRVAAGAGLLWTFLRMLLRDGLQVASLEQIVGFAAVVAAPALAAWAIERAFGGHVRLDAGLLRLDLREARIEIPLHSIVGAHVWRLPLPRSGIHLLLASGERRQLDIALRDPAALLQALAAAGAPMAPAGPSLAWAQARAAEPRRRLDHPLVKFVLFPLLLALPAFRLHQHIAFGGTFGEWHLYGAQAWLTGLLIWWAAWSIGMTLLAAALRLAIELVTVLALWLHPATANASRRGLEWLGRLAFFAGVPLWMLLRILGN